MSHTFGSQKAKRDAIDRKREEKRARKAAEKAARNGRRYGAPRRHQNNVGVYASAST